MKEEHIMKNFVMPKMTIVKFDSEDIITASGTGSLLENTGIISDSATVGQASYGAILNATESYTIN
jgi:hypothetical protein